MVGWVLGAAVVATWLYLAVGRSGFWRTSIRLPSGVDPQRWPSVVAIVPARDEAAVLPATLPTLLAQQYPGSFRVIVVDDDSGDGTGELAGAAGADVVRTSGPPSGWVGKVAAQSAGTMAAGEADLLLFTDADIAWPPHALTRLVRGALEQQLVLTSQMVRLRAQTGWERLVVPAFVYFFAQLYPFAAVNRSGRTAAAAGGCMLVDRAALERAGGLAEIRAAVIDDVALAKLLKPHGGIWLGLTDDIRSVRAYPRLTDLWQMITRSAYTQLRHSPLFLGAAVIGLMFVYVLPPTLFVAGLATGAGSVAALGAIAWALMTATYMPTQRFYGLAWPRALLLPVTATLYAAMTIDSARRHRRGRGAEWKGRVAGPPHA